MFTIKINKQRKQSPATDFPLYTMCHYVDQEVDSILPDLHNDPILYRTIDRDVAIRYKTIIKHCIADH